MLSELCWKSTARVCFGSWPLTYSELVFYLLCACLPTLFESEVAHNVMSHIFFLES